MEVSWQNDRPRVTGCSVETDNRSPAAWSIHGRRSGPVNLLLSPGEYRLLMIDAPPVAPHEMRMAVRWRIKDMIDFPVEDAIVDVIRLDPGHVATTDKLMAVVARNDLLKRYIETAERANVTLASIDIPELAQRNIAALLETEDRALAMLSFTPHGGLLTVTRAGELCFHRHFDVGRMDQGPSVDPGMHESFERLTLDLQRSLDHVERQYSHWRLDRIVLAPPPSVPNLADHLRANLYLPLEIAELSEVFDAPLPDPATLAACWFALGGALRRERKTL
ncbi:MAG: agglutinin biogenesis protein MshI [Pseudomonadota bacterium]